MQKPTLPRVVGISWFKKEDYPALLKIFEDGHKMPRTHQEWLKGAQKMERQTQASGYRTQRIHISPETFPEWCRNNDVPVNSVGRHKFVATTIAEMLDNQTTQLN
jgi:hypothetical protein